MSAKAFYHKSPPVISTPVIKDIQPELWSMIIRYAAESGSGIYEYEMTPSEHADFLRGEDKSLRRSFYTNFRTRSYLSRVNKAWYAMTAPFLFEYIHLALGRRVASLCEAVLRSKEAASSDGRICSFGWWTKRLDIHIRHSGDSSYAPFASVVSQLTDMIACFPNLRILSIRATPAGYDRHSEILTLLDAVSAPKSLKVMHWGCEQLYRFIPSSIDTWTAFLERHPNLQSIRGPDIVKTGNNDVSKSLRALWPVFPDSGWDIRWSHIIKLTDCPLPNLFSFHCNYPWFLSERYLQMVGPHIFVLHLKRFSRAMELSSPLAGHLPNLVELDLELLDWIFFTASFSIPLIPLKSLKTLGLSVYQPEIPGKELRRLLDDVFPSFNQSSITTIRFLLEKNIKALRRHSQILAIGTQRLASLGMTLQDHQYQPLLRLD